MSQLVRSYEADRGRLADDPEVELTMDPAVMNWHHSLIAGVRRSRPAQLDGENFTTAMYRPFFKQRTHVDRFFGTPGLLRRIYPTSTSQNLAFYALNPGAEKPFSILMTNVIPDLAFYGSNAGQLFPRFRFEPVDTGGLLDLPSDGEEVVDGYQKLDNITDEGLRRFVRTYGADVTKDDIFFYVYGLLHSSEYREAYAADLKRMLPRIPLVTDPSPFFEAGRELSEIHLSYESADPYRSTGSR